MWIVILLVGIGLLILILLAVIAINTGRLDRRNAALVRDLLAASEPQAGRVFRIEDLEGLPPPVRRYLAKVIPEGQPYVATVRLHQVGEFRLGDATSPWKPLEADQVFTTTPPGFVWQARIEMAPLTTARVIDMYKEGTGALNAHIFSTLKVADAPPSRELDSGELMRYLGEATWFPTAYLPGQGVEWSPIDDRSARATATDRGTEASLIFYFDEHDLAVRMHGDRWYQEGDGPYQLMPWTGYCRNYQVRAGLLIPTEAEVEWNLPAGDLSYWRATTEEIEHNLVDQAGTREESR